MLFQDLVRIGSSGEVDDKLIACGITMDFNIWVENSADFPFRRKP